MKIVKADIMLLDKSDLSKFHEVDYRNERVESYMLKMSSRKELATVDLAIFTYPVDSDDGIIYAHWIVKSKWF